MIDYQQLFNQSGLGRMGGTQPAWPAPNQAAPGAAPGMPMNILPPAAMPQLSAPQSMPGQPGQQPNYNALLAMASNIFNKPQAPVPPLQPMQLGMLGSRFR